MSTDDTVAEPLVTVLTTPDNVENSGVNAPPPDRVNAPSVSAPVAVITGDV